MKARKFMGMIACAGACVSLSAFANTTNGWFGVAVENNAIVHPNCETNGVAVTIDGTSIVLENDSDSALTITPASGNDALSDGLVTITSSAVLTPSDASELGAVTGGAQAGFAVAVAGNETNFYGYASASKNGEPDWNKLSGTVPAEGTATSFSIVLDYRTSTVRFYKDGELLSGLTNDVPTSSFAISNNFVNLNNIAAYGSGSINSITSQYEVAVVAYNNKKYGSVADAIEAGGTSANIMDVDASGHVSESSEATCGLSVAVCKALGISTTASAADAPAVKVVPAATDTETAKIKLQLDPTGLTLDPGVVVKFSVKKGGTTPVEGSPFAADAIMIPLGESSAGEYVIEPADVEAASN